MSALRCCHRAARRASTAGRGRVARRRIGLHRALQLGEHVLHQRNVQGSALQGFRDFFRDYVKAVAPMTLGNVRIQRMNTPAWKQHAEAEPAERRT